MFKKDKVADIEKTAQQLLDEHAERIRAAKRGYDEATVHAERMQAYARDELNSGSLDRYREAKSECAEAQDAIEYAAAQIDKAREISAEEQATAKEVYDELGRVIRELNDSRRLDLQERMMQIRKEAKETQQKLDELANIRRNVYMTFIGAGGCFVPECASRNLGASVKEIENAMNMIAGKYLNFN